MKDYEERTNLKEERTNTRVLALTALTVGVIGVYSAFKPVSDNNYKANQIILEYKRASNPQEKSKLRIEAMNLVRSTTSNPRDGISNISPDKREALEAILNER